MNQLAIITTPRTTRCTKGPIALDLLSPLISNVPSFTIMDGSIDFMKWISSNVINGSLPLLQICYIKEQRVDENGVYRHSHRTISSFTRHQILKGAMIHFINGRKTELDHISKILSPSLNDNTSSDWQSFSFPLTPKSSFHQNSNAIMDNLFGYLDGSEKLFIIERVCRSWLEASKVNGCGWKSVIVSHDNLGPPKVHTSQSPWKYLLGENRVSRIRHIKSGPVSDDPDVFDAPTSHHYYTNTITHLNQWFPLLLTLQLEINIEQDLKPLQCGGAMLAPLRHCQYLAKASIDMDRVSVRSSTKEWTCRNYPHPFFTSHCLPHKRRNWRYQYHGNNNYNH
jgi:hypothetical protein